MVVPVRLGGVNGVPFPIGDPPEETVYQLIVPLQFPALIVTGPGPHLETGVAVGAGGTGKVSIETGVVVVQAFASLTVIV